MIFAHGGETNLHRCKPHRERARIVFDENAQEPFGGTEDGAMDNDRAFLCSIRINIIKLKAFRQVHVELNGRELPLATKGILKHEVEFWPIERRFTDTNLMCPSALFNQQ